MTASAIKQFFEQWEWTHWLVLCLVVFIASHQVYKRQMARVSKTNIVKAEVIEEDIRQFNTQSERLAQLEVLPPVKSQWDYVVAIADRYGVQIDFVSSSHQVGSYNGPLASWTADLKGTVGAVLVAAKDIQEAVPTYLYGVNLKSGNATIRISVLGSE